jgi:hypothetical protein
MSGFKAEYKNKKTDISYREVLTSPWLGAIDFDEDKDTIIVLEYAFSATAKFEKGRDETCIFGRFKGYDKDIVINSTNAKQIHKFAGTDNIGAWKNIPLSIYIDTNVKRGGEIVSGWRIRPKQPKLSLPALPESGPKYDKVVERLASGEATIEAVRMHFTVSDELADKLMTDAMHKAPVQGGSDA